MRAVAQTAGGVDLVQRVGRLLVAAPPPGLVSAYVFGSQVDGTAHRESDLDIGILLHHESYPTPRERFEQRVRLSAWLQAELHWQAVDVVVLNDAAPQLARHVVHTGRHVFCSNRGRDHAFVRDVQLRAADLEPFLQRMRRLTLEAIAR